MGSLVINYGNFGQYLGGLLKLNYSVMVDVCNQIRVGNTQTLHGNCSLLSNSVRTSFPNKVPDLCYAENRPRSNSTRLSHK